MKAPRKASASRPRFNPNTVERRAETGSKLGDERSGALYVYSDKVKLAVNVALATGRPLLVRGAPGWGKSSLAAAVARYLDWRYLEKVISSRTQARDLMSEVDLVRRLGDAQAGRPVSDWRRYIRPGVLWKAFDPVNAERQEAYFAGDANLPASAKLQRTELARPAVVLLDEMDKAEPDVPNNLLVALGSLQFVVEEIGPQPIEADSVLAPLIIVTTNDERDLPRAFLRRCVELELPALEGEDADGSRRKELLVQICTEHMVGRFDRGFVEVVADLIFEQAKKAPGEDGLLVPSPAEFIDTLRALYEIHKETAKPEHIAEIADLTVRKRGLSGRV